MDFRPDASCTECNRCLSDGDWNARGLKGEPAIFTAMMGHPESVVGFASSWSEHPNATRILVIVMMFAMGYLEGPIMKQRNLACVTWTIALLLLSGCIAYWLQNPVGIVLAGAVFLVGMTVIAGYYKQAGATSDQ